VKKLAKYAAKRDFTVTPEPPDRVATGAGHSFVVQKHAARALHYDFRLELDGVLKSWAVPKGPSLSPAQKRLAVEVEDHPLDYRDFEGTIPEGQYGGGEVIVWDRGSWTPVGDPHEGLQKGHLRFALAGEKLHGGWSLLRIKPRGGEKRTSWLLIKSRDEDARDGADAEVTESAPASVLTGRPIEELGDMPAPPRSRTRTKKTPAKARPKAKAKAKPNATAEAALPAFEPQLATLVDEVPTEPGWLFEIKLDGYRVVATIQDGEARLMSRNGLDWTARFAPIAAALPHLRVKDAVVDGEVCVMDPHGRTSFQRLQNTLSGKDQGSLVYVIFDLLHRDGEDLRSRPLLERKKLLATILAGEHAPLALSMHIEGNGEATFAEAHRLGLEGIIAKRADAPYRAGRSTTWLKIKCDKRQEFVVVGYTPIVGRRVGLGALLLAVRDPEAGSGLRFVCKVGTGFTARMRTELLRKLEPLATSKPPVADPPRVAGATWVRPLLVCEVRFTEWTDDGALRHPAFLGLREDKAVKDVVRERAAPVKAVKAHRTRASAPARGGPVIVRGVAITHEDRVVDEASGITKGELARYYDAVADLLLPYAKGRPLAVVRCPGGRAGKCFFQRHAMAEMGPSIGRTPVGGEELIHVSSAAGILELVQFGVIELHGWGSRLPATDKPDWIVLDLDPDEGLPFARVAAAALTAREVLRSIGLESWVKTTGGKGLHVVAPFRARYGWDVVKPVAQAIAADMARQAPDAFTASPTKAARHGKIYLDVLRNGEEATAVLPYSARARDCLTVAMPISWDDVRHVHPQDLTVRTVPNLLALRADDPWAGLLSLKQKLPQGLGRR
jgi:bifunctional non-homologous end joining protein LigD